MLVFRLSYIYARETGLRARKSSCSPGCLVSYRKCRHERERERESANDVMPLHTSLRVRQLHHTNLIPLKTSRVSARSSSRLRRDFVAVVRGLGVPDRRGREVPRDALAAIVNGAEAPEALVGRRLPEPMARRASPSSSNNRPARYWPYASPCFAAFKKAASARPGRGGRPGTTSFRDLKRSRVTPSTPRAGERERERERELVHTRQHLDGEGRVGLTCASTLYILDRSRNPRSRRRRNRARPAASPSRSKRAPSWARRR